MIGGKCGGAPSEERAMNELRRDVGKEEVEAKKALGRSSFEQYSWLRVVGSAAKRRMLRKFAAAVVDRAQSKPKGRAGILTYHRVAEISANAVAVHKGARTTRTKGDLRHATAVFCTVDCSGGAKSASGRGVFPPGNESSRTTQRR